LVVFIRLASRAILFLYIHGLGYCSWWLCLFVLFIVLKSFLNFVLMRIYVYILSLYVLRF